MKTRFDNPPITVTREGTEDRPPARETINVLDDDEGVTRKIAYGKVFDWEGRRYTAGELIRLPVLKAAELMQKRVLVYPDHTDPGTERPVTVTQVRTQEPTYDAPPISRIDVLERAARQAVTAIDGGKPDEAARVLRAVVACEAAPVRTKSAKSAA